MKYSDDVIRRAVSESKSWAGVCRILRGIDNKKAVLTGMQWHIRNRAKDAGVDSSHFTGQAWNRGQTFGPKRSVEYYLCKGGPFIKSNDLKKRLIRDGLKKHQCESCMGTEWMGHPIPIELDHIDGDHDNNLIGNLRILCPNCHAQTETYCGKNI